MTAEGLYHRAAQIVPFASLLLAIVGIILTGLASLSLVFNHLPPSPEAVMMLLVGLLLWSQLVILDEYTEWGFENGT